jgi:hypothetical protein
MLGFTRATTALHRELLSRANHPRRRRSNTITVHHVVARFEKDCWACGQTLDSSEFHRNITTADGFADSCKSCTRAAQRARYWSDPEAARARGRRVMAAVQARRRERTDDDLVEARIRLAEARGKNVLYVGAGEPDSSATSTAQAA